MALKWILYLAISLWGNGRCHVESRSLLILVPWDAKNRDTDSPSQLYLKSGSTLYATTLFSPLALLWYFLQCTHKALTNSYAPSKTHIRKVQLNPGSSGYTGASGHGSSTPCQTIAGQNAGLLIIKFNAELPLGKYKPFCERETFGF